MTSAAPEACPRCGSTALTGRLGMCPRCLLGGDPDDGSDASAAAVAVAGPDEIGGLELLDELGRGGMGTVYRARDKRLGRHVAVKFLPDELASRPELRARFLREARAMAALQHPGIVGIHDLREADGQTFLVMELVQGQPLSKLIPLPFERALDLMTQVCDALSFAHARGIVHRDVKPENVLVDDAGRAKVADFGIARILGEERDGARTQTGVVMGTPHFMAPEAVTGAAPDPRMDVFSAGVLLYQMLTGKLPVGAMDPLPATLDAIVKKALAHEPADRYRDAGEMRDALRALGRGGPRAAAPALLPDGGLPADERMWIRAVALIGTAAVGATLWALLASVTPRVFDADEIRPLIMLGNELLGDGRVVSWARFEPAAMLAAVAAAGVSFGAWAFLRRHWRLTGLHTNTPDRALPEARRVMVMAIVCLALYALRRGLEYTDMTWPAIYLPILGGLCETAVLFLFLEAMLESQRTHRPLTREPLALAGMGLALVPPALELARYLGAWSP